MDKLWDSGSWSEEKLHDIASEHLRVPLINKDPDDNKFVDCAIFANADFIVSDDKHFNELGSVEFPKVLVVRLDDFARLFRKALNQ